MMQYKPDNPYPYRSIRWALMEEDWSDLTYKEIAEVFDTTPQSIQYAIAAIKKKTGYTVITASRLTRGEADFYQY